MIIVRVMKRALLICLAGAAVLAGVCLPRAQAKSQTLNVVAAESVYGNIVAQIGGTHVAVTSILDDPNADPHLYEPGTSNALAVAKAKVVIQNGLGYDAFMSRLESASPNSHRNVITISDVLRIDGKNANPHLWYDVPALNQIAAAIAGGLEQADPTNAAQYRRGLARFEASLTPLRNEVAALKKSFAGEPVAYTEPVPGYLLTAAGIRNVAPDSFTRAIEDGSEPSPAAVAQMTGLASGHKIKVLLYNSQTVSPITSRIRSAAQKAGIPIVGVTETLPPGQTFQQWQLGQAKALYAALAR
jgi:zinc/manganese transport system substrate-binding protein